MRCFSDLLLRLFDVFFVYLVFIPLLPHRNFYSGVSSSGKRNFWKLGQKKNGSTQCHNVASNCFVDWRPFDPATLDACPPGADYLPASISRKWADLMESSKSSAWRWASLSCWPRSWAGCEPDSGRAWIYGRDRNDRLWSGTHPTRWSNVADPPVITRIAAIVNKVIALICRLFLSIWMSSAFERVTSVRRSCLSCGWAAEIESISTQRVSTWVKG